MEQWGLSRIYLATEDAAYCEYFRERFGEKLFYTDQERYTVSPGERLSDRHRKRENRRDGFLMGAEYILSVYLLSRCRSLIASGGCAALGAALDQNQGRYEHTFVFQSDKLPRGDD
jgi:hypothetical protein